MVRLGRQPSRIVRYYLLHLLYRVVPVFFVLREVYTLFIGGGDNDGLHCFHNFHNFSRVFPDLGTKEQLGKY